MTETMTYTVPEVLSRGPLAGFGRDLNRFLGTDPREAWSPTIDFFDDGEQLILQAELAGVKKEDLDIHIEDAKLEVRGERDTRRSDADEPRDFHRERRHGRFRRTIALPAPVDAERVDAELEHGLLTVTLPKLSTDSHHVRAQ